MFLVEPNRPRVAKAAARSRLCGYALLECQRRSRPKAFLSGVIITQNVGDELLSPPARQCGSPADARQPKISRASRSRPEPVPHKQQRDRQGESRHFPKQNRRRNPPVPAENQSPIFGADKMPDALQAGLARRPPAHSANNQAPPARRTGPR